MIKLYQFSTSPFAEKVRRGLAYKGLPYDVEEVVRGDVASGRYAGVNQSGKFPAIDDDGVCISDSTDILRHLEERYPSPPLIPANPHTAAMVHIIEDWADESLYFYEMTMRLAWEHNLESGLDEFAATLPDVPREVLKQGILDSVGALTAAQGIGRKPRAQVVADVERHFSALDGLLTGGKWLAGAALSAADIAAAAQLTALLHAQEARAALDRTKYVAAWLTRVNAVAPAGRSA